jgi:hypothetical protein
VAYKRCVASPTVVRATQNCSVPLHVGPNDIYFAETMAADPVFPRLELVGAAYIKMLEKN